MSGLDSLRRVPVHLFVRAWSTHGGTERYCQGFARWLLGQGVVPTVWCQHQHSPAHGVVLRALRPSGRGRVGRLLLTAHAVSRSRARGLRVGFLRAAGFDVLRAGGGTHAAAMQALGAARLADRVERYMDREALGTAGRVVANSARARADILAETGRDADSVRVVRNGVDLGRFRPAPADERERAVVFVGHGFARKGLKTAIEAMALLPGVPLWVVGWDRRQPVYERLARSLGLAQRVRFLGRCDDPSEVVRRAGALVLPTRYDPSANVVLEALACGVPPVTTRADGASEVVPVPWLVVDNPLDAPAIAVVLGRALGEPALGKRCRDAAEQWSQDRSFSAFAQVLELACREVG